MTKPQHHSHSKPTRTYPLPAKDPLWCPGLILILIYVVWVCADSYIKHILDWSRFYKHQQGVSIVTRLLLLGYSINMASAFSLVITPIFLNHTQTELTKPPTKSKHTLTNLSIVHSQWHLQWAGKVQVEIYTKNAITTSKPTIEIKTKKAIYICVCIWSFKPMVQIYLCKFIYAYAKNTNNTNELLIYIRLKDVSGN